MTRKESSHDYNDLLEIEKMYKAINSHYFHSLLILVLIILGSLGFDALSLKEDLDLASLNLAPQFILFCLG